MSVEIHYISPSVLPSASANSIHVVRQTRALADLGAPVMLYACRAGDAAGIEDAVARHYGVSTDGIRLITAAAGNGRAVQLRITGAALSRAARAGPPARIVSRNLYAAYAFGVAARRPLCYEIHEVETGIRGTLQRSLLMKPWVRTVAISEKLRELLADTHGRAANPPVILHDAAPAGLVPLDARVRKAERERQLPETQGAWRGACGYFGQLHPGRGIDIIAACAARRPDVLFLVFGGNDEDVHRWRDKSSGTNLKFPGPVPPQRVMELAPAFDVLLMPYQHRVSIGVGDRDTARWMSPMKMFEYMAAGVPIIASDLPVLREVLTHNHTALLVPADDPEAWSGAVDRLLSSPDLANAIAARAHAQYAARHTWRHRAQALLELV